MFEDQYEYKWSGGVATYIAHNYLFYKFLETTQIAKFMGPIWGRQDPGGPHVGPMNFAIREYIVQSTSLSSMNTIREDICPSQSS